MTVKTVLIVSYACAMLEVLVPSNTGRVIKNRKSSPSGVQAHKFWDEWLRQARSAVLVIPSVLAPFEFNALINPAHPDFPAIAVAPPIDVVWDSRLFDRN